MPHVSQDQAKKLIARRHPEWLEFQEQWRFALDSLEAGERYRHADYSTGPFANAGRPWYAGGPDAQTGESLPFGFHQIVKRNLIPHRSEMSREGRDLYVMRLHRTPVPMLAAMVARRYLARVYARQVTRDGPAALKAWWEDVDGKGTEVGEWFRKTVAPVLLAVGHVDLVFGRPEAPDGPAAETRADLARMGLDACVAGVIRSENVVWWRLTAAARYAECLVYERHDDGSVCWRHWTDKESLAYDGDGAALPDRSWDHGAGACPVVRVFDDRKLRCGNTGEPRLGFAAEVQREVWNRQSELVISDIQHTHTLLQTPEDYCKPGNEITYGPGGLMPMLRVEGTTPFYQGTQAIDMPQSGAAECRTHILDAVDDLLRHYGLLKPAGASGADGRTVAQSGVSKAFDTRDGNDLLAEVAHTLQEAEETAATFALRVLAGGDPDPADLDATEVEYPREFELFSAEDLAGVLADVQAIGKSIGTLPATEGEVLKRLISVLLPGLGDDRLAELHSEVDAAARAGSARAAAAPPATAAGLAPPGTSPGPVYQNAPAAGAPAPAP